MSLKRVPIRRTGKRHWRASVKAGNGVCRYCNRWRALTWDHVIPRSLAPELRSEPLNLLEVCAECNEGRTRGFKPAWADLPIEVRAFVIEKKSIVFAQRYFEGVPDERDISG